MIPYWLDGILRVNYGDNYLPPTDRAEGINNLVRQEFLPPMWDVLSRRFSVEPKPLPSCVIVTSPSAKPMIARHKSAEYFVIDDHLFTLLNLLTTLGLSRPSAHQLYPVVYAIYAERAYAAGRPETAALIAAKAKVMRASMKPSFIHSDTWKLSFRFGYFQFAFVLAHELSHLILRSNPDLRRRLLDTHARDTFTILKHIDKINPPMEFESTEEQRTTNENLQSRGYALNIQTRREFGTQPSDQYLIRRQDVWAAVSDDEALIEECVADAYAVWCLFGVMRTHPDPIETSAISALIALTNIGLLQHLDHMASGVEVKGAQESPHQDYWLIRLRCIALRGFVMSLLSNSGNNDVLARFNNKIHIVNDEYNNAIENPFLHALDFEALEQWCRKNEDLVSIASPISGDTDSLFRFLGFGDATERAEELNWYIDLRAQDSGADKHGPSSRESQSQRRK